MADSTMKKYLDLAGLKAYDEKIKGVITASEGKALQDAKDYVDGIAGKIENVAFSNTNTLASAIVGEKTRAEGVEGALNSLTTEAKGNLVAAINEVDAHADANAAAIGVESKAESAEGAGDGVTATGIYARLETLEAAVGEGGSVDDQIDAKINALDVTSNTSDAVAGVTVAVTEEDGKVQKPVVTVADNAVTVEYTDGTAPTIAAASTTNVLKGDAIAKIAEYVGDVVAELDVKDNVSAAVAGVTVKVDETDGKVVTPVVTVADNAVTYTAKNGDEAAKLEVAETGNVLKGSAIAEIKKYIDAQDAAGAGDADARLDKLEALHATKTTGEGENAVTTFKTVSEEVNEAITDLVDGAPAALDTLKEIADWIANQDETGVTDVASLVSRVDTLSGDATKEGSVAKSIKDAVEALDVAEADATGADQGVSVALSQVDGEIQAPTVAVTPATVTYTQASAAIGTEGEEGYQAAKVTNLEVTANDGNVLDSSAIGAIKSYVDAKVGSANSSTTDAINALDATVKQDEVKGETETSNMVADGIAVSVTETDGKLTAVSASINTITADDIAALFPAE